MRTVAWFFCLMLWADFTWAQDSLAVDVVKRSFVSYHYHKPAQRKVMRVGEMKWYNKVNPVVYVSAGAMFFYQRVVSEQLFTNCTYGVSCSSNAKLAIEQYGMLSGVLRGAYQLSACSVGVQEDYAPYVWHNEFARINRHSIEE